MTKPTIQQQFAVLRTQGRRHRDAAADLGLSEGEAIAAHVKAENGPLVATPLRGPWIDLLQMLEPCGPLLALTRNDSTVHEKTGVYEKLSGGHVGLALGKDIDLRIFFDQWHAGFAVREAAANAGQPASLSLQFYDAAGNAVHKIFARETTDRAALESVIEYFADPAARVDFKPIVSAEAPLADAEIDVPALVEGWAAMQDTHEFFGLLRKFKAERQQALRLVQGRFTQRAATSAVRDLLNEAAMDGTSIMVFVGSRGCIQIHTGAIKRVEPMEIRGASWLNVLDPGFNLHMREDQIASVWLVEKPTADGVVTYVEAFDHAGELMAMFFGERKPGSPELEAWRHIVRGLPRQDMVAA